MEEEVEEVEQGEQNVNQEEPEETEEKTVEELVPQASKKKKKDERQYQLEEEEEEEEEEEVEEEEETKSLFEQLFDSYQQVTMQLQGQDGLENVLQEYERLFDAAKDWYELAEAREGRAHALQVEAEVLWGDLIECRVHSAQQREEIFDLKDEMENLKRLADSAHLREQASVEIVAGLRAKLAAVNKDMDHKARVATEQMERKGITKVRSEFDVDTEHLVEELAVVHDRLERAVAHTREVEAAAAERQQRIDQLAEQLDVQTAEKNKEERLKERFGGELVVVRADLVQRDQAIASLSDQLAKTTRELRTLEGTYKALKLRSERMLKENKQLAARNNKLQQDMLLREGQAANMRRDVKQRTIDLKALEVEVRHQRKEASSAQRQKEAALRKAEVAIAGRSEADTEVARLKGHVLVGLETELRLARDSAFADARTIERVNRDKDMLTKALDRCQDVSAEQAQTLRLQEQARRATADELDVHVVAARRQRKQINNLELERDRLLIQSTELEVRVQETLEEVRLKQMALYETRRCIEEGEARFRHQQNLYDAVRDDRNTFAKQLLESQDEILELKHKLKVQGHHVEQMKEDVSTKEVELRRATKLLDKMEKEKDKLRLVLQAAKNEMFPGRAQVVAAAAALARERRLMSLIEHAETEHRKMLAEIEQLMSERDILGSQLVRRNDEVSLLYEKIHLLEMALRKGEAQYSQRLDDIRLFKMEVRRLRNEKVLLQRSLDNMAKLRHEMFLLQRDLTRERNRASALEEELQNPLNVHRWRMLQGTDPPTFQLIKKVQLLQKRLLAQAAVAIEREVQLRDSQRLYAELRQLLERQPPDAAVALYHTQHALRERGRKMKALSAESSVFEAQVAELKSALEHEQQAAEELRREVKELQQRERRLRAAAATARAAAAAAAAQREEDAADPCGALVRALAAATPGSDPAPRPRPAPCPALGPPGAPGPRSRPVTAAARAGRLRRARASA